MRQTRKGIPRPPGSRTNSTRGNRRTPQRPPPHKRPDHHSPAEHPAPCRILRPPARSPPVTKPTRVLTHIVCGAGPATEAGQLVKLAQQRGWTVQLVATPAALDFLDVPALEALTGSPVRSQYRKPGETRSHPANAIIVAPATYNTINKWANGISDTYALGILAETTSLGVPIVVLPFVNSALASRAPFHRSIENLRAEGVHILLGGHSIQPHEPHTGGNIISIYPWDLALNQAENLTPSLHRLTSDQKPN